MALETQSRLQDIRLRVLNNESVSPLEMRELLTDLRRDRESTARAAASARRAVKKASAPAQPAFDLDTMFAPR